MLLTQEQRQLIATILVLVVAGSTAIKRLTGNDILGGLLGRGMLMQIFYLLVAISVICIAYKLINGDMRSLPSTYAEQKMQERMP